MDPERWHEVDRLFEEALDRPPAERPAFLDAACAGDAALRREVERLLAADEQGAGFLEGTPADLLGLAFAGQGPATLSGRTISHFRIGEPLGLDPSMRRSILVLRDCASTALRRLSES